MRTSNRIGNAHIRDTEKGYIVRHRRRDQAERVVGRLRLPQDTPVRQRHAPKCATADISVRRLQRPRVRIGVDGGEEHLAVRHRNAPDEATLRTIRTGDCRPKDAPRLRRQCVQVPVLLSDYYDVLCVWCSSAAGDESRRHSKVGVRTWFVGTECRGSRNADGADAASERPGVERRKLVRPVDDAELNINGQDAFLVDVWRQARIYCEPFGDDLDVLALILASLERIGQCVYVARGDEDLRASFINRRLTSPYCGAGPVAGG